MQQEISLLHKACGDAGLTKNDDLIVLNVCNKFPPRANKPKPWTNYNSESHSVLVDMSLDNRTR